MREVKYRGRRLDNGAWEYGDLIENQGRNFIYHATSETTIEDNDDGRIVVAAVEVDHNTVGQYTGLKDRNGKKIYEGDIVTEIDIVIAQNRRRYQVVFETGAIRIDGLILARYYDNDDRLAKRYIVEVIGNIHDNPELLKGGEQ